MKKYILLISLLAVSFNAFADEKVYTKAEILELLNEPGTVSTVSYAVPPKTKINPNPGGLIDCAEAVENQTGQINVGHPEVCIEVPKSYSNKVNVSAFLGTDKDGFYKLNDDGTINQSQWKSKID